MLLTLECAGRINNQNLQLNVVGLAVLVNLEEYVVGVLGSAAAQILLSLCHSGGAVGVRNADLIVVVCIGVNQQNSSVSSQLELTVVNSDVLGVIAAVCTVVNSVVIVEGSRAGYRSNSGLIASCNIINVGDAVTSLITLLESMEE